MTEPLEILVWPRDDEAIWAERRRCGDFTALDPGLLGAALCYLRTVADGDLERWRLQQQRLVTPTTAVELATGYYGVSSVLVLAQHYAARGPSAPAAIPCARGGGIFAGALAASRRTRGLSLTVVVVPPSAWHAELGIRGKRDDTIGPNNERVPGRKTQAIQYAEGFAKGLHLPRARAEREALADAYGVAAWWAFLLDEDAE